MSVSIFNEVVFLLSFGTVIGGLALVLFFSVFKSINKAEKIVKDNVIKPCFKNNASKALYDEWMKTFYIHSHLSYAEYIGIIEIMKMDIYREMKDE